MKTQVNPLKWFKNQNLGKKIVYAFILSSLIPLVLIEGIMLYINSANMTAKMNEIMGNQLIQMAERVNLNLNVYTSMIYQIYIDDEIINNVSLLSDPAYAEKEVATREILGRIQQYGTSAEGIVCISIITADGKQVTYDFHEASAVKNLWDSHLDYREIEPYKAAQTASGVVITPTEQVKENEGEKVFHISKEMYDYKNIEKGSIATVVMSIDESVLNKMCIADNKKDSQQKYSVSFIMDQQGNVLSYPDPFYAGIKKDPQLSIEDFVKGTGILKEKDTEVNRHEDTQLGWVFYNIYDKKYMLKEVYETQRFTVLLGLLIVAFSAAMIFYTTHLIRRSTRSIIGGIRKVQDGNLDVKVQVETQDEFGKIADNFNNMTDTVQNLIQKVTDATKKQKEAEIRALEAQINPHFLYNTLDSINWMAIDKGEYEISRMVVDLGVILRYSVNKSNQKARIAEVADWLRKYISLQQVRFNNKFDFELSIDKHAENIRIYKLLLQPFVENSIVHGFKELTEGGMLRVDISLSENREAITIIIEDNGKGMRLEQAARFNSWNESMDEDDSGIGLANAFTRLKMYYGDQAAWDISSILGVGTVITLKIPVQEGENSAHRDC